MTPGYAGQLLAEARGLREGAGIRQATVCSALGLFASEVSKWERALRVPQLTAPHLRYLRFLDGLRRARINQAAAMVLMAEDERYAGRAVREQAPEGTGPVGAAGGVGRRVLLRDDLRESGRPVDQAGI